MNRKQKFKLLPPSEKLWSPEDSGKQFLKSEEHRETDNPNIYRNQNILPKWKWNKDTFKQKKLTALKPGWKKFFHTEGKWYHGIVRH